MTRPLAARLRRLWLEAHLWIGVGLLGVLAPFGVSGALLVWHDGLDRALQPARYAVTGGAERPPQVYAVAAQAAFAGRAALAQLRLPQQPGDPVVAVGRLPGPPGPGGRPRSLNAWIDPPSGRVLDTAEPARGFTMTLHRLHGTLMIPEVGRKVVGWLGWAMFASCATGLWLWWPRRGGLLLALRWRRGASELYNLHHMLGFWICLPLAALSITGVVLSFPQTADALVGGRPAPTASGEGPRGRMGPPLAAPTTPLAQAVAAAQALRPGARITAINWPQAGPHPAWRVELEAGAGPALQVAVDDASGSARPARAGGGPQRSAFAAWSRRIHDGTGLGLVWRCLITLAGLAPAVLGATGLAMWLRRRKLRL